tara:strand:- start:110 stop:796 length:687 start_codon:yes stop_codon:yes gene_type:complete
MKKLLILLTLGLMFGQTNVASKLISYDLSMGGAGDGETILISEIVGYDLERGTIQFVGFDGDIEDFLEISYIGVSNDGDLVDGPDFYISPYYNGATEDASISYYFDSNINYMHIDYQGNASLHFNGTLYFIVTAEFPDMDTGYMEEDFDFCINEGLNLVSYPCENDIAINDALPSEISNNLSSIVGEGVAGVNVNGTWVGSLTQLQAGSGYWFKSSIEACFNYECAEN